MDYWLDNRQNVDRFPEEKARDFFLFSKASRPDLRTIQPPILFLPELRRSERESYYFLVVPSLRMKGVIPTLPLSPLCTKQDNYYISYHIISLNITQNSFPTSKKTLRVQSKDRLMLLMFYGNTIRHAEAQLVEALRYTPEGRGFDPRWYHWNFSLT